MSQMVTRKSAEEKDSTKGTDSPVKEMKKKIAANAEKEKEKQAAEKNTEKPAEKSDKHADKPADKDKKAADKPADKDKKAADKTADKKVEKNSEKSDKKIEKSGEKSDKKVENKQPEKKDAPVEKKEAQADKKEDKGEKSGKGDKDQKPGPKPKQNGSRAHNGVSDVTLSDANGTGERDVTENGTVSDEEDDVMLVIDYENEQDELFPELSYDDTSDVEGFEPPTPESHSRSFTRRSQVKVARTPETPRPASDKQADRDAGADDSKDSKVLKLKDDATSTDRKLRSSDSPKKETKKSQEAQDSPKKDKESPKKDGDKQGENGDPDVDIIDIDDDEPRKLDTNYSKSRVKVSPYRRSMRIADQTTSSVMANYTGDNTTMEMDITENSSFADDPSLNDSSYLSGLRGIRGRRSYKQLKEITLRHATANRSARSAANLSAAEPTRPTGTVVGRKRKPDGGCCEELAGEVLPSAHTKRMRLLERISMPFRRTAAATQLTARMDSDIVGINTDLPLTASVSTPDTFDPESLKPTTAPMDAPIAPTPTVETTADNAKRCIVM